MGCGKAHAAARAATDEDAAARSWAPREAMGDTDVLHNDLALEISSIDPFNDTCLIVGTNSMHVRSLVDGLTEFTFRLRGQYGIDVAEVTDLADMSVSPVDVTSLGTVSLVVTLDRPYDTGEEFILTIGYYGNSISRGFGSIDVSTQNGVDVVATLSEPYYAYTWWPVKDGDFGVPGDNGDKATLDLTITVPNNFVVPSNGVLVSAEDLGFGQRRYHWHTDYPTSTYLVAFAATNYTKWTQNYVHSGGNMPVEFYIYPGNDSPAARAAWEQVIDMMYAFRDVYGEYPFVTEKYGHYQFNFGGGMEHQTMTGLGTFDEGVIAHELGHQWWGDMVTCRTWSDIWLNEGFATFSECLWEERKTGVANPAAYVAAMLAHEPSDVSGTVYVYPAGTADLNTIFSYTNSYLKGAWVVHQLRGVVGDATFFQVLADYREAFEYAAATTDDFAAIASATSGQDLTWFFDQWVYGPGAPAYSYGWQSTSINGKNYLLVRIAQTHNTPGYPNVFTMPVELVATVGGQPQSKRVWNNARTQWFAIPMTGPTTAIQFDPSRWILRTGAVAGSYAAGPPKVVESSPLPGAQIEASAGIDQISVWFTRTVSTDAAHFSIVGDTTGAQSFTLSGTSNVNPVTINLDAPLAADAYTLTISDALTGFSSAQTLDGELADASQAASLPSGDGVAGGSAVIRFSIVPCNMPADINVDCVRDETDIDIFSSVLIGIDVDPLHTARSDLNASGAANAADIQELVDAFLSP